MRTSIIVASINKLFNLGQFKGSLRKHDAEVIVIDEGDSTIRKVNDEILNDIKHKFYGPIEREKWFKDRFGKNYEKFLEVIPERSHAETSFGFLVAYEEGADVIIELDDDVFPVNGYDLVESHLHNLLNDGGVKVSSKCKWYNTLENLILSFDDYHKLFPRGHPYSPKARLEDYTWKDDDTDCVLNMGLWSGHPDLDALTILSYGGLDGRCCIKSEALKRGKVVVGEGTYFTICSMNTSFVSKIIPAFYQLYMNHMGIDRFDDIWSGILLKKIADHLSDKVCLGKPLVCHNKRPRNVFKDLRSELEGMAINEVLWKIVESSELDDQNYYGCYQELTDCLEANLNKISANFQRAFLKLQVQKMRLWLSVIDKLK
jgi:hypothetical protein